MDPKKEPGAQSFFGQCPIFLWNSLPQDPLRIRNSTLCLKSRPSLQRPQRKQQEKLPMNIECIWSWHPRRYQLTMIGDHVGLMYPCKPRTAPSPCWNCHHSHKEMKRCQPRWAPLYTHCTPGKRRRAGLSLFSPFAVARWASGRETSCYFPAERPSRHRQPRSRDTLCLPGGVPAYASSPLPKPAFSCFAELQERGKAIFSPSPNLGWGLGYFQAGLPIPSLGTLQSF